MEYRSNYTKKLQTIKDKLEMMSKKIINSNEKAKLALENEDINLCEEVITEDKTINSLQIEIEDDCIKFIATEQPVATDLRIIISIIKIVDNLERMGDHSKQLAKTLKKVKYNYIQELLFIIKLASRECIQLLEEAIYSFLGRKKIDIDLISKKDDTIDNLCKDINKIINNMIKEYPDDIKNISNLYTVNRAIGRFGDNAVNIAEWIYFIENGIHFEDVKDQHD